MGRAPVVRTSPELDHLHHLIAAVVEQGTSVSCLGGNRDWWTSEKPDELEAATHGCQSCPVLDACAAHREHHNETGAVFAGYLPGAKRPTSSRPEEGDPERKSA